MSINISKKMEIESPETVFNFKHVKGDVFGGVTAGIKLRMKGVLVLMIGAQPQQLDMMKEINIIPGLISDERLFRKFDDCKLWLKNNLKNKSTI